MRRFLLLCLGGILLGTSLYGAERKVLAELITNTGCPPCAPANQRLDQIYENHSDHMTIIRYHAWWPSSNDPFYLENVPENTARINYYGADYTPHLWIDGIVDGDASTSQWESMITNRMNVPSPLVITLTVTYDLNTRTGQAIAEIYVESDPGSGNYHLRYALVENNIEYHAPNGESHHQQVMRDMIPDPTGIPLTLQVGQTIVDTQTFTVDPGWQESECQIVVFVQNDVNHEVLQSEDAWIFGFPLVHYAGFTYEDGGNGYPNAGDQALLYLRAKNAGRTVASAVTATLASLDPHVTVSGGPVGFGSITPGEEVTATDPFSITIDQGTPDPYFALLEATFTFDTLTTVDTFPVMIASTAGFADDMESGQGAWETGGQLNTWHLTEYRYNSPTHSWNNAIETSHTYPNGQDAWVATPYVLIPPAPYAFLAYSHLYQIENGYDYAYVEISPDGENWEALRSFTGFSPVFYRDSLDLSHYAAMPLKIRVRFTSDGSVSYEGFYFDDVQIGLPVAVEERPVDWAPLRLSLTQKGYQVEFSLPAPDRVQLLLYDAAGRRVLTLARGILPAGNHRFPFNPERLPAGVYILKLETGRATVSQKLLWVH